MAYVILRKGSTTSRVLRSGPLLSTPVLLAVSPNTGPIAGGTAVTLTGYGFTGATSSSLLQPGFTVVNDTTITGVTVAHAVGVVSATVTNAIATSAPLANAFTYSAPLLIGGPWTIGDGSLVAA